MNNIKHILCAVDFSEMSGGALRYAIGLAERLEASITVLNVYEVPGDAMPGGPFIPDEKWETWLPERVRTALDEWLASYTADTQVSIVPKSVPGVPYVEIPQAAKDIDAQLIVIGTHGRTGLAHMLLGSVAERVVRTSEVPVLTIRRPQ